MTIHSEIQAGRDAFYSRLQKIRDLVATHQLEQAASEAEGAAADLWLNGFGIYHSLELEALLGSLGSRLGLDPPKGVAERKGQVTVATVLFATGGHSRICWRMFRARPQDRHTLVLTRQGKVALPRQILDLERDGTLRIVRADAGNLSQRAHALSAAIAQAEHVVLLTHPDDALPTIVLGAASSPPPVMLIDHATHAFWLGATISNVLLSVAPGPVSRRGFPADQVVQAPLPLELEQPLGSSEPWVRQRLNIAADSPLLFSCAADYKYYPIDDRQLAELLVPTLERHPTAHLLVVGVSATPMWTALSEQFPERIHLLGQLPEIRVGDCYRAADIYLDSFPVPSLTAMLEAAACGKPIVRFAPQDWRSCGFSFDYEGLTEDAYVWTTPEDYAADLDKLIADPAYRLARGARNRTRIQAHHASAAFSKALDRALEVAAHRPRLRPSPDEGQAIQPLDELLYKLATNNTIHSRERLSQSARHPIRSWLGARRPTPAQARLIDERFDALPRRPAVGIFIRVGDGEPDQEGTSALMRTLHSIRCLEPALPPAWVTVFCAASVNIDDHVGVRTVDAAPEDHAATINRLAAEADCDWLLTVDAGDEFTPAGLLVVVQTLLSAPDTRALCADEMIRDGHGNLSALLRPDFNLDLLLSLPALAARRWIFRRDVFVQSGGLAMMPAGAAELDLLLRLIEQGGLEGLAHAPEPLLVIPPQDIRTEPSEQEAIARHLAQRGYDRARVEATLPGCYRIHYGHQATPGVSIIIPTKNQLGMLQRCVETLLEKTAYKNYEVLIVDNGSDETDAVAWLDGIEALQSPQLRVLRYPYPFNYSAINNFAASQARGEYLVLLNNDTAILREDWLDALLNHAQRPEVGIVGAKLLYPNGTIQHAGVILGLRGPAEHPFIDEKLDAPGYMYRLQVDQNYTAVTGACLMVRKSLYAEVGGLDEEAFKVSYNDVDLCLKVRSAGYLVVWTPHALVLHEGSVSQKQVDQATQQAKVKRFREEQDVMYDRWLPWIARDPAYNRNLTLQGRGFAVDVNPQHNWHPLDSWRPLPVAVALAADQDGCGQYRIIQPVNAMNTFGVADAEWSGRYYSPIELERRQPDVIVLQRQMFEDKMAQQKRLARFSRAFRVAELDDYLPLLPRKSAHHGQLPKDVLRTMREALKLVDRFVVSTPELAEALDGLHGDIRVVENHLPLPWWQDVRSGRREGGKPRVGWGGGAGHRGDLELIADVVRALADEVDWVFFGMCPESLRPYVREYHPPVAIADYPAKLASLDLDLALAPLEDNLFNRCKSNLRLLEYGACGFPVVCSDIAPYQGNLPVTRVKPRFRDWVDAIQMHVRDRAAAAKAGDALRAAVCQDWMLDERHARFWVSQWLPD